VCRARFSYAHASTTRHSAQAMSFGGTKLIVRFTSPTDRPTSLARGRFRVGLVRPTDRRAERGEENIWVGTVDRQTAARSAARKIQGRNGRPTDRRRNRAFVPSGRLGASSHVTANRSCRGRATVHRRALSSQTISHHLPCLGMPLIRPNSGVGRCQTAGG